ncbi:uncharacterized protein [Primulina huaijiensis]|uniref:uncharacterized protein n=1 Tax=Primulina huaijiensis TaxID=1492673 RepID=UPI003CC76ADA
MERESQFQTPPPDHTAAPSVGEAYINGFYEGLSFHTLLTYDPYGTSSPPPATYGTVFDLSAQTQDILLMPKSEPQNYPPEISTFYEAFSTEAPPYNFFSDVVSSSHHHLPSLLSLEPPRNTAVVSLNRNRRRKQQKLSEKTRCLQKLLPWDKKMDMTTVLEEAYKYIKFLQAQVSILQAMPNTGSDSHGGGATSSSLNRGIHGVVGDHLGRLNQQQLLQVLLHSPIAQTLLYSNGCCVYSLEQLLLLNNNAERKAQFSRILFDPNTNAWGPDYYTL